MSRRFAAYEKGRALTPMWAMWRSLSVGTRLAPSASQMSWPWAHVSMSRAVSIEVTDMEGPYHGHRAFGSAAAPTRRRVAAPSTHSSVSRAGSIPRSADWMPSSPPAAAICFMSAVNLAGSEIDHMHRSSIINRWMTCSRTSQPSAGVGRSQAAGPADARIPARSETSAARSSMSVSAVPVMTPV